MNARRLLVPVLAVLVFFSVVASSLAVGDANQAACSHETEIASGFRTYLPDCRAYELVSPPFTESFPVELEARSADGSRMIVASFGAFAGTEVDNTEGGSFFGTTYEFTRGAGGWSTVALGPPASVFSEGGLLAPSASLERTLWKLRLARPEGALPAQPEGTYDLWVREAAGPGGSCPAGDVAVPGACFALIGPGQPPGHHPFFGEAEGGNYRGKSGDLTHVLIAQMSEGEGIEAGLWPGDKTVEGRSLYEYSGLGEAEPKLVGVRNKGPLASNTEAKLIGVCGTRLGGPGDAYNAISASGATVFFTANECFTGTEPEEPKVNELYARINGSETVDVSEPTTGPAGDCELCNTSSREEAHFQGASEDGSKVFFLSEQTHLLPLAEGPNLYEYDFKGPEHEKLVRVSGEMAEPEVRGVVRVSAKDGSHVYFVAGGALVGNQNENKEKAKAGADNLYVYEPDPADPGHYKTVFIAMLCSEAGESGSVSDAKCHASDEHLWRHEDARPAQATPDGRFLVFSSSAQLTSDDTSTVSQIFEYDAQTGSLVRVSRGQLVAGGSECAATKGIEERFNCDGNTKNGALAPLLLYTGYERSEPTQTETSSVVSEDGSYVFFMSPDGLAGGASPGLWNVYEYHDGNVYLISDGQDAKANELSLRGTDASGHDVFFETRDRLVGQDTNAQNAVYDARVDGGFPGPVFPAGCTGESCQGSPASSPGLPSAGSVAVTGGGNLSSPPESKPKPKAKPLTRAQKLADALRACGKKPTKQRAKCKARARTRYGAKAKKSSGGKAKQGNGRVR